MKRLLQRVGIAGCMMCLAGSAPAQEPETDLTESEILAFLESNVPGAVEILDAARTNDPAGYQRQIRELGAHIAYYHQVHKRSPDYAESLLRKEYLMIKSRSLARQIRDMEQGPDRETRMEELQALLEEQFDLELRKPAMEVEFLEQEVSRLKQRIEQQRQSRDTIVGKRLRAMTVEEPEATR